jgi:hypothetical protein
VKVVSLTAWDFSGSGLRVSYKTVSAQLCKKLRKKFLETAGKKTGIKAGVLFWHWGRNESHPDVKSMRANSILAEEEINKEVTHHELLKLLEQIVVQCDCLFDRLNDQIACSWFGGSPHSDVGWWDVANWNHETLEVRCVCSRSNL